MIPASASSSPAFLMMYSVYIPRAGSSDSKEYACNTGDVGWIADLGRPPGEGNVNPLQYSCLENSMENSWQATVHSICGQGAGAKKSNSTSKERWLHGCRRAMRSYSMFKVRRGDREEIPLIQGKEQQVRFCWSSREEIPHIQGKGNPSKMVGAARGHQKEHRLKPQSQTSSQSDHMDHSLV